MAEKDEYDISDSYGLEFGDPALFGHSTLPGAYSVNMRPMGERPHWSHPNRRLDPAPSEHSVDLDEDDRIHEELTASASPIPLPPLAEPFQWRPKIVFGWLLLLGSIGLGIGLRYGLNAGGSEGTTETLSSPNSPKPPSLPCQIELESDFNAGEQPSIYEQCECMGSISYLQPEIVSTYEELRGSFIPNHYGFGKFEVETHSCEPKNLALTWLAIDNSEVLQRSTLRDRYAGATLFYSLNGTEWREKSGWLSSASICDWAGISCVSDLQADKAVSAVDLTNNKLNGTIPSEISLLKSLSTISVTLNNVTGSLPSEIGSLDELVTLNVATNKLTGGLPAEISGLSNLQLLDVSHNSMSLQIPTEIGLLTSLTRLSMSFNTIISTIPTEVGQLQNLRDLDLQACDLMGKVPSEIGLMSNLARLELEINSLTNFPTEVCNLRSLKLLSMSFNVDLGSLPSEIGNLSNLEALVIGSSGLQGSIPEEIASLQNLAVLDLGDNRLTGTIPAAILEMSQLEVVRLVKNGLTGPVDATNATALTCLDTSSNHAISSVSDAQCPSNPTAMVIISCPPEQPCSCCTCASPVVGDYCLQSMRNWVWQRFFWT